MQESNPDLKVSEVISVLAVADAKLVAGHKGLNKTVTGINVIESKNIMKTISGGEILITSLYPTMLLPYAHYEFCEILAKAGVSALAVKIGNCFDEIPQNVLDIGNQYDLPIIELPVNSNFSDIMHLVMLALYDRKALKLQMNEMIFDRLSQIMIQDQGMNAIITELAHFINKPILLLNEKNKVLSATIDTKPYVPLDYNKSRPGKTKHKITYFREPMKPGSDQEDKVILPIFQSNELVAHLVILGFQQELSEIDYMMLEDAVTFVSLEFVKHFAIVEVENRFKYDILDTIAVSGQFDTETMLERGKLIGWQLGGGNYTVIQLELENINQYLKAKKHSHGGFIGQLASFILDKVPHDAILYIRPRSSSLYLLWQSEQDAVQEEVKALCNQLLDHIEKSYKICRAIIGVGSTVNSLREVSRSYQQATDSRRVARMVGAKYINYTQLGVTRLLCTVSENQQILNYVPESIHILQKYDKENSSNLFGTLSGFFEANCNASLAAKKMFIHYKTMLYRLEKIKSITGMELENSQDRLEAEVGIQIVNLYNQFNH